mgnify:CR=1 FL=1
MKHYLDFEKPIVELQRKLEDLKRHPETHALGIGFDAEIKQIETQNRGDARTNFYEPDRLAAGAARASSQAALFAGLLRTGV